MQKEYGIIGYPLSHSFSPGYFNRKFAAEGIDAVYNAYPLPALVELHQLIKANPNLAGLNVTIPYKQKVLTYLNSVDADALQVGAVNCIDIRDGMRTGYNTDIIGFRDSLVPLLQPHHTHALVLGTGGASRAVCFILHLLGISYQLVSRQPGSNHIAYDALTKDAITSHTLIINTTPLGMHPHVDACPEIPYGALTERHLLYDLIYNPAETKFLALGRQQGAATKNGEEMLILQAEASWDIWNR